MKKVIAIFLAILILTTNAGLTFAMHYCGGKVVKSSVMLGEGDLSCGMTESEMKPSCDGHSQKTTIKAKSCCQNEYFQLEIEDDFNSSAVVKTTVDYNFIVDFVDSYVNHYSFNALAEAEYLYLSLIHI